MGDSENVGYMNKLEKGGLFSRKKVKPLFFMLRMSQKELEMYMKGNSMGLVGEPEGKPKALYKFTNQLTCKPIHEPKHPLGNYVFELHDPETGSLQLGCHSEEERQMWAVAFKHCVEGLHASDAANNGFRTVQDLEVSGPGDGEVADTNFDARKLPMEFREQLAKAESLYEIGLFTKLELEQTKPIIIAQAIETMAARPDQWNYDSPGRSALRNITRDEKGDTSYTNEAADTNFDVRKLPMEFREQLAKAESMYEIGLFTKLELEQTKPIIIAQAIETMAARPD